MIVKIIAGIKHDGNLYEADSLVDFDESFANELIESGEAEAYEEPKVVKPKSESQTNSETIQKKSESTEDNPLVKLPYRTLQVKAGELGAPKVVGLTSGELAEYISSTLSKEEVATFLEEASQ